MSSSRIKNILDSINSEGCFRFNCPICGGINTFSVTKTVTCIKYYCFHARCKVRGLVNSPMGLDALKSKIKGVFKRERVFSIPDYWIHGLASKKCLRMLLNMHTFESYRKGLYNIAYDPKEDRIVYMLMEGNKIVGAVGRALTSKTKPKTINYPNSKVMPFICGTGDVSILVEDCISASRIGENPEFTGIALLGTNLKDEYIQYLVRYKTLIVTLDADAKKTGMKIYSSLKNFHKDVKLSFIKKDIKNMTVTEYENWIKRCTTE